MSWCAEVAIPQSPLIRAMSTVSDALDYAVEYHRDGQLERAQRAYRRILEVEPEQPDAWHLLGVACHQAGDDAAALDCITHAIRLNPDAAEFHNSLGATYRRVRQAQRSRRELRAGHRSQTGLPRGAQQPGDHLAGPGKARRSNRMLSPGAGVESRLSQSAQQPRHHLDGPGKAQRGGGLLSPGLGDQGGLSRCSL